MNKKLLFLMTIVIFSVFSAWSVPFNEKLRKQTIDMFKLVIDRKYVCLVFDKKDQLIGFGLTWPNLADAMQKTHGRMLPFGLFKWLHDLKHPKSVELGIISVKKEYQKIKPALVQWLREQQRLFEGKEQANDK